MNKKSNHTTNHGHGQHQERTLVVIKPDGIQRSLIGEIIARYEKIGLKLVGMKMLYPTPEHISKHYTLDPQWLRLAGEKSIANRKTKGQSSDHGTLSSDPLEVGQAILEYLVGYMTAGPVVAMVWQGPHAVAIVRKITGSTEPLSSDVGTIRGDFVIDSYEISNAEGRAIRNLVHASTSPEEAENEIAHWFSPNEVCEYLHISESLTQ